MTERWKTINDFPNYRISNLGNVLSLKTNKILKQNTNGPYNQVILYNPKPKLFRVHILVADHFLFGKKPGYEVDHIDENKRNNKSNNLQYLTRRMNLIKNWSTRKKESKYIGVSKHRDKWAARILIGGKRKYIGLFNTQIEASESYQSALSNLST